jgi:nucleoid-associated protein YgaU
MAINSFKALILLASGCVTIAAGAYAFNVRDPILGEASVPLALPQGPAPAAAPNVKLSHERTATHRRPELAPAAADDSLPSFDVVRAGAGGTLVVAGKAQPYAKVEIVADGGVIGSTEAGPNGDFAMVLDDPLTPGDYQLSLRSTGPDNVAVTSRESAVVSIPTTEGGQVLALVDRPGEASRLLAVPKPKRNEITPAVAGLPTSAIVLAPGERAAADAKARVAVEAVEIEGRKIFLAGTAEAGRMVRGYMDDLPLGETRASDAGRFLIEAEGEFAVGDHTIRVDRLGPDGVTVSAAAAVPFRREVGADVAAVSRSAALGRTASAGSLAATEVNAETAVERLDPKLQNVRGAVIIRHGDTLWRISQRVYGYGTRYSTIYLANQPQISDPNRIWPGQVFSVPERTPQGEAADLSTIGEQRLP